MKKSTSKLLLSCLIIIAIASILLISSAGVKKILFANKSKIEQQLSLYLKNKVKIEEIHYLPPNFIILKQISVKYPQANKKNPPLVVRKIMITFLLGKFIKEKKIAVNRIAFYAPVIDYDKYQIFFKENIEGILKAIKFLAQGRPLKLVFDDVVFIFDRRGSAGKMLLADVTFQIDLKGKIKSLGRVNLLNFKETDLGREAGSKIFKPALSYEFEGVLVQDGLTINNLEFDAVNFQSVFQGQIINNVLNLKGFSTINRLYGGPLPAASSEAKKALKDLMELIRYGCLPKRTGVVAGGINILDINCLIRFASKNIKAENIEFLLNNIPVRLKAAVDFSDKIDTKIELSTFSDQSGQLRQNNPQRFDFNLKCMTKEGKTSGQSDAVFFADPGGGNSLQRLLSAFNNISAGSLPDGRLKIFVEKMTLQYVSKSGVFNFLLNNLNAMVNLNNKNVKFINFDSRLYDGDIKGHIAADAGKTPPELNCKLSVANVSAWQLESLLLSLFGAYRKLPAKLQGRIDGKFTCDLEYVNYPSPSLKGSTVITDGYLDNVTFFVWLGNFFGLPSLNKIDFRELYVQFESTQKASKLKNIKLKSENISLEGDFSINQNEFVSSSVSIMLARDLLETSPKFNLLLALMEKKAKFLNFDFQLSGVYGALNFKWQKSAFKQRLKKMLPGFVERGLERKVEKALQSISPEKE